MTDAPVGAVHQRRRPGVNHLLFPDAHPHAGGAEHHAAFLEDDAGYEVELVAR